MAPVHKDLFMVQLVFVRDRFFKHLQLHHDNQHPYHNRQQRHHHYNRLQVLTTLEATGQWGRNDKSTSNSNT
jgi:hypothetical protein